MRYYHSEGIVVRGYDLKEADRIVVILSPLEGIIRAVAKGVRRPRSKLAGLVQQFSQVNFMFYRGRQLDTITQGEVIYGFRELRSDLDRMASAAYVGELAAQVARERQSAVELYQLVLTVLKALSQSSLAGLDMVLRRFELGLLEVSGYAPELNQCVHCSRQAGSFVFSASDGGIVCNECKRTGRDLKPATLAQLKVLRNLPFSRLSVLRLKGAQEREIARVLQEFLQYCLEFRPKSLSALAEIRNLKEE